LSEASPALEKVFRSEWGRLLGGLVRRGGDLDAAEEALQEAAAAALEHWPADGVPHNPAAWLATTAARRLIDKARRRKTRDDKAPLLVLDLASPAADAREPNRLEDDELRLLFLCCHPALSEEAQVALTLSAVGGLGVEAIAAAFLAQPAAIYQRLGRAKRKIAAAAIPFAMPGDRELEARLAQVAHAAYLIFNEGYNASSGPSAIKADLCGEAIFLARRLARTFPAEPELVGLLALLLLHDARRPARLDPEGDLVPLEDQDRTRWLKPQIAEGLELVHRVLKLRQVGPFQVQAAIAALHAEAEKAEATDWPQIALLYRVLERIARTPVVRLNRGVAVAMAEGPEPGLALLEGLEDHLDTYHLLPAARADLLRRAGRHEEAAAHYRQAIALAGNDLERRFLEKRLADLTAAQPPLG
jgi:RNA polymerase sigma-70 factor (ECF subfamily)